MKNIIFIFIGYFFFILNASAYPAGCSTACGNGDSCSISCEANEMPMCKNHGYGEGCRANCSCKQKGDVQGPKWECAGTCQTFCHIGNHSNYSKRSIHVVGISQADANNKLQNACSTSSSLCSTSIINGSKNCNPLSASSGY